MKMVKSGSAPIGSADGMDAIKGAGRKRRVRRRPTGGQDHRRSDTRPAYVEKLMEFVDVAALTPMKVLVNAGHGAAGPPSTPSPRRWPRAIAPLEFIRVYLPP